jgi:KaiC/GvpD/RAD55 family RecA-like ATPase
MEKIRVDIPGLDLVLGGGIPAVRRADDLLPSTTLLVRGPPGSGKSVFGTQLAGALARELGCDVAYGCVEILPHELREQHASFGRAGERVIMPPFPRQELPKKGECRIFAAVLDLGEAGTERSNFGSAVIEFLDAVKRSAGEPRVMVIDSLSDGYGLGASVPRKLADELCKVAAERGMFLVLLEETIDGRPSSWSFATDIVFGLETQTEDQAPDMPAPFDRRVAVMKNRFAPSDAGPHRFTIEPSRGVVLFPRPSCYLAPWAKDLVLPGPPDPKSPSQEWSIPLNDAPQWPKFRESMTAVYGSDAGLVSEVVWQLGIKMRSGQVFQGVDVFVHFGQQGPGAFDADLSGVQRIFAGDPFLSGNCLLAQVVAVLEDLRGRGARVRRVLVGDFRSIRTFWNPDGIRRAIGVLIAILRRAGIPAILFETTAGRSTIASQAMLATIGGLTEFTPDMAEPAIVDLADVFIEVATNTTDAVAVMTDVSGGHRHVWTMPLLQKRSATPG